MNEPVLKKHFQLPTQQSWSHTWSKPVFQFLYSEHFNGRQFCNLQPAGTGRSRLELWKWILTRKSHTWQVDREKENAELHASEHILPKNRPNALIDDWQIWFVGHATVLIQIGPYNFLTDPVWCERASPFSSSGPQRVIDAGIALEDLPHIDAVLLSHNH